MIQRPQPTPNPRLVEAEGQDLKMAEALLSNLKADYSLKMTKQERAKIKFHREIFMCECGLVV